ncbi:MAG: hypothetical protein CM1200mP35_01870 [Chloroflexota bacterium]|nr:MAG: hypothetical protein CM1200mP35_01870 [Chloroflexota bacterium]
MKFGSFIRFRCQSLGRKYSKRIWQALDQIVYAEEMGYERCGFQNTILGRLVSNSAPDLPAAVTQRPLDPEGDWVVLALFIIHYNRGRMATLDILRKGRVDFGLGRTGYLINCPPRLDLEDTVYVGGISRGFPKAWTRKLLHEVIF